VPETLYALVFPYQELKIFQFPSNMIPRIDGNPEDWNVVPEDYIYGTDMLLDVETDENGKPRNSKVDPKDNAVRIRVGWVQGLNRLYFLYEAYDNYWDFESSDFHNDMLEISVDGDVSGGEFEFKNISEEGKEKLIYFEGSHAQNYHICTPAVDKSWAMAWNCPAWLNKLPYLNCAYSYSFKHGESGKLIFECWITPFDYISFDGPEYSIISQLCENKVIGLSWLIADWDGPGKCHALPSLSHNVMQVHDASYLRPFRLMPIEKNLLKPFDAYYTFTIVDMNRRIVAFIDRSRGVINSWKWDFGDGSTSKEQNPIHIYKEKGQYIIVLTIEGPQGKTHYSTLWEVLLK
jgi:hypothetical protein